MSSIFPMIGERCWFWGAGAVSPEMVCHNHSVPMHARIVYVHSPEMVNLRVVDHAGHEHAVTSVTLLDPMPTAFQGMGRVATWTPQQVAMSRMATIGAAGPVFTTLGTATAAPAGGGASADAIDRGTTGSNGKS